MGLRCPRRTKLLSHWDHLQRCGASGIYQLIQSQVGFKQSVVDRVELLVNQTARLDLVLQVGAVAESVEVTGAACSFGPAENKCADGLARGCPLKPPLAFPSA